MRAWLAEYDSNERARHAMFFVGLWWLLTLVLIDGMAGLVLYVAFWLAWRATVRAAKASARPPINGRPPIQWRQDRER